MGWSLWRDNEQAFHGPRHGDVEETPPYPLCFVNSHLRERQQACLRARSGKSSDGDDGELQTLGRVHGDDFDDRRFEVDLLLFHEPGHEASLR